MRIGVQRGLGDFVHLDLKALNELLNQCIFHLRDFAESQLTNRTGKHVTREAILNQGIEILHQTHALPPLKVSRMR